MSPWLDFLLHALATYRLALMVSKESGPGWIFKRLRRQVAKSTPKAAHLDEGINCLFCVSMQLAIILSVARVFLVGNPIYDGAIFALAISAIAVVLNQSLTKGKL